MARKKAFSGHTKLCGGSARTSHFHETAMQSARADVKARNDEEAKRIRARQDRVNGWEKEVRRLLRNRRVA